MRCCRAQAELSKGSGLSTLESMDENLKSGMGTEAASHSSPDAVHSVVGENVDESFSQLKDDVSNAVEETTGVRKPYNEPAWKLDDLLALGTECLNQFTPEGRAEDLEQTKMIVVTYMGLVCEHRNQLDSRPDLKATIGDFAARFLHVLFHLKDYEGCISWFEMGMGRDDALRASLEASGSVQFDVAVSFLKRADGEPEPGKLDMFGRGVQHLERSCQLQVKDFDGLSAKMRNVATLDVATGELAVRLGHLQLVPGEMFEKLLGTPHSHFTPEQAIELLDEVLRNVMGMKANDFLVEAKALLRMGLTFAWKIEDERTRDRYMESFQTELCESYDSSHQNEKAQKIDQGELREALQSKFAGSTENNLKSNVGTEVASTSGNVDVQQPCEVQVWKLDELLALGTECLNQFTPEGRAEDREQTKMIVVTYMGLVCEHRNQLDSRPDLKEAIDDFAARFLHVLFHLKDYEGCISWFEMGMGRDDALRASLEDSGSVQFDVAVSFLKRAGGEPEPGKLHYMVGRGVQHLERSCQLQVKDFDGLSAKMRNVATLDVATGELAVRLGRLQLVPGEMFEKLLGTPHSLFGRQELEQLLDDVMTISTEHKDKDCLVEAEAVLEIGMAFAWRILDREVRNRFLDSVLAQLRKVYVFDYEFRKAAELTELRGAVRGRSSVMETQLFESMRAEDWSLARNHDEAIEIISSACSAFDMSDARGVLLPDRKLKAHLKFTYGRILERAGRVAEAVMQMEEALSLCVKCDGEGVRDVDSVWYNGDDVGVNIGLCRLLQLYRGSEEYLESALSLIDLIDPIMVREECEKLFRMSWFKEKGLLYHRIGEQEKAKNCLIDSKPPNGEFSRDDAGYDSGNGDAAMESYLSNPDKLYDEHLRESCSQCNGKHLRDPKSHFRTFVDLAECHWNDIDLALEAADAGELVAIRRLGGKRSFLVDVYMLKGRIYSCHQKYDEEVEAWMRAVKYLQEMDQNDDNVKSRLTECYVIQAWLKLESGSLADGRDLLKKAPPVFREEDPGMYYFLEAMALRLEDKIEEAATFGEMAFKEFIKRQQFKPSHTQIAEGTGIKIFEGSTLLHVLHFNEMTSLMFMKKTRDALIWAERSRTRFYMRRVDDQPSVVYSTCELFDKHYEHAEELLGDAVLMCGPETAIISYSYCNRTGFLFCYLVFKAGECQAIRVHCEPVHVPTKLRELGMPQSKQTLEQVVDNAVTRILRMQVPKNVEKGPKDKIEKYIKNSTEKAKDLLNVLYSILIKPIFTNSEFFEPVAEQLRDRCKNLVISPQGFLSKVPFAALFEKQGEGRGEFLIQQKTVCIIPSVRTLHRCFQRQAEFEKRWEDLAPPFVAGNPKPMGAGKTDLPGAAAEALKVANILEGAQLFSGERMTKAAVLQGLGRSQLVLLATHSIKDTSQYPQGALVLRRQLDDSPSCSVQFPTSNNVRTLMEETLIPADIAAIPAEIPAGLVVLSACQSGLGKITQTEGVLGLGRVILQKGAATVVLTLWNVDDSATTDLVTGMFEKLRKGLTVPESLQASMVHMIDNGRSMYEWAPLFAMGSPKLRLPKYSSESPKFEFTCTITPDPSEVSELSLIS